MPGDRHAEEQAGSLSVDVLILCYHAVSPDWRSFLAVAPDRLRAQVRLLLRRGYVPKTLAQALEGPRDERAFVVTFDDGYRSILDRGFPVLDELGVPATVFVPTELIDKTGLFSALPDDQLPSDQEELRCMSWDEVRHLADAGWEVGSHTVTHPHLPQLDDRRLRDELVRSREVCEQRLQAPCPSIAYPFGSYDRRVVDAARASGYKLAVTLESRLLEPISGRGPLSLPREGVFRETRLPKYLLNTSRQVRRMRLSRWYRKVAFGRLGRATG